MPAPFMQTLEPRRLRSGDVHVVLERGGDLHIIGDHQSNSVRVNTSADLGPIGVFGVDGTTINGGASYSFGGRPMTWLQVFMGRGDDHVVVSGAIGEPPGEGRAAERHMAICGENGNDRICFVDATLVSNGEINILGGRGNDVIWFLRSQFPTHAAANGGAGRDRFFVHESTFGSVFGIRDPNGLSSIDVHRSTFEGPTKFATGNSLDRIRLTDTRFEDKVCISMNRSDDVLFLDHTRFAFRPFHDLVQSDFVDAGR